MLGVILTIALVGLIVWLILQYIPMPAPFKTIILVIAAIFLILYLMSVLGIGDIPVPHLRR